jgi:hypothetical protein
VGVEQGGDAGADLREPASARAREGLTPR